MYSILILLIVTGDRYYQYHSNNKKDTDCLVQHYTAGRWQGWELGPSLATLPQVSGGLLRGLFTGKSFYGSM